MSDMSPTSPQRLALDLQRSYLDMKKERERSELLLSEVERLQAALARVQGSVSMERDSRLQAEDALNETRDRLELAVQAAGLALWDYRHPFTDVYLTARWGELIGDVALEGTWETQALLSRVHPQDAARVAKEFQRLVKGEIQSLAGEYRFKAHDKWIWLETHAMVAEKDELGRVRRLMGTHANVTTRKLLEEKNIQSRQVAEEANRAKSEFLANMSHEVRTPLNAIMGLNQLLLDTQLTAEQRQWLGLMADSSRSLLNLLNDLLDLSRIEAGKLTLEQVDFPLRPLFENKFLIYKEQAQLNGVQLSLSLSPELPAAMSGDPFRIRQVIGNVLSNALKFTPSNGRVSLSVEVGRSHEHDHEHEHDQPKEIVIRVADTGIGISQEQQRTIFDAFTQADASTARQYGGSGLGLAICSRLVSLMGGRMQLESALGRGSTFDIRLPLGQPAQAPALDPKYMALTPAQMKAMRERFLALRVLVAEDNPVNELLIRNILEKVGCDVRVARNGEDAVRLWEEWAVDLILMDVQMPLVNGVVATARIREQERKLNTKATPILAVTANAMAGDRQTYIAAGMSGYVVKPIEVQNLLQTMAETIGERGTGKAGAPAPLGILEATPARVASTAHTPPPLSADKHAHEQASQNPNMSGLMEQIAEGPKRLQVALAQHDSAAAKAELDRLRELFVRVDADRALRICKGLEMALNAGEWGLFSRALPLLKSEVDALLTRLT